MSVTVEELVKAHELCLATRAEVDQVDLLYPVEGVPFESALYEAALTRKKQADDTMRSLMSKAAPEVLAEARRKVRWM